MALFGLKKHNYPKEKWMKCSPSEMNNEKIVDIQEIVQTQHK